MKVTALPSMILFLLKEYLLGGLCVGSETGSTLNASANAQPVWECACACVCVCVESATSSERHSSAVIAVSARLLSLRVSLAPLNRTDWNNKAGNTFQFDSMRRRRGVCVYLFGLFVRIARAQSLRTATNRRSDPRSPPILPSALAPFDRMQESGPASAPGRRTTEKNNIGESETRMNRNDGTQFRQRKAFT